MDPFLRAEGLTKRYGRISALRGVDFQADRGSAIVVLGPNGAGKSTLLGVLAGTIRPTGGRVALSGELLGRSPASRGQVGYLGHASHLYRGLTARENLLLYGKLYGVEDPGSRADELLNYMGLWERRNDRVGGFSRGMEQRLSITRCLLHDPRLLLLDEPFSGLDHQTSRAFVHALDQLRDGRRTLIMATHDLAAAPDLGDEVVILNRGRVVHRGEMPGDLSGGVGELYAKTVAGAKS